MKLFYLLVFILSASSVHAQQVFRGTIVYDLKAPQDKGDAELTINYGVNKIKIRIREKEKEDFDKTWLLVDLDSGKSYTIHTEAKTFESKKLAEANEELTTTQKTIAGYVTNPINISGGGLGGLIGFSGHTVVYAAPDLYFPVPKKYSGNPQLLMIQDNHIVLGAEIKLTLPGMGAEIPDSLSSQMKISAEAKKILPGTADIAEFSIPADFTLQSRNYFSMTDTAYGVDSTAMYMDSVAIAPDSLVIEKPPAKVNAKPKPKPSTPKKTTPTKTEAVKPKNTQTKS
jgi:hypothetical protein